MNMRAGFKGIASSVTGAKGTTSKGTQRVVDIFWYLVYAAVAILFAMMLYKRFTR